MGRKAGGGLYYGWILVAAFCVILIGNLGFPMYGGAVLNAAMARELHISRQMLGLPYSVFLGVIGLSSPLVAWIIGRIGVRWTLVVGNLAVALGAAGMATIVRSGLGAVLVFGVVIGFGVASGGNLTAQTAIPRWFVKRRALAFALMLSGSALGGAFAAPVTASLLERLGGDWRQAWWALGGVALLVTVLAGLLVRDAPGEAEGASVRGAAAPAGATLATAIRDWRFWVVGFSSAAGTGAFGVVIAHAVSQARDAGYSSAEAARALAVVSVAGLGGKFVVALLGDRLNPAVVWAGLMACMAAGLAFAAFALEHDGLYAFAVLFGVGLGGFIVGQPATVAHLFGSLDFARIAGVIFFIQALAGVALPWAAGWSFDELGSYRPSFVVLITACLVSAALLGRMGLPAARPSPQPAT